MIFFTMLGISLSILPASADLQKEASSSRNFLGELKVENPSVVFKNKGFEVSFDLIAENPPEYPQEIEIRFYTSKSEELHTVKLEAQKGSFKIFLEHEPLKMVIDDSGKLNRKPAKSEIIPNLKTLLNKGSLLLISDPNREIYEPFIEYLRGKNIEPKDTTNYKDITQQSAIILGVENPFVKKIFGHINKIDADFSLLIKKNPWDPFHLIGIVNTTDKAQLIKALESLDARLEEYAGFSTIAIKNGEVSLAEKPAVYKGIEVKLRKPSKVVEPPKTLELQEIIEAISHKKIIYLGEYHDRFSHHYTQLQIIKELLERNKKIAIGMEMFQRPFQQVLDDYISRKIEEKEFLKKTEYFKRWGFDYNLYKPILDFARENSIPVIALNLSKEIIEKVSRAGLDSLSEEEKKEIPEELDFSDEAYRDRLKEIFHQHKRPDARFEYFYQSQILWDETMAMSIDEFLKRNPAYQIIVLAGGGHIAYGSGIPKRTYRRNKIDYSIVLIDAELEKDIAHYIIYPEPLEGILAPRLGLSLREDKGGLMVLNVQEDSLAARANIKKGDVLIKIDDSPVSTVEDLRILLFYKRAGDSIKVKVLRKYFLLGQKEIEFNIKF